MTKYRIVTFDGGVLLGVIAARFVERLNDQKPTFLDEVNLLAGTSVGALFASMLAIGAKPNDLMGLFQPPLIAGVLMPYPTFQPSDRGNTLPYYISPAAVIQEILQIDIPLSKIRQRLLIPTFDLGSGTGTWQPVFQSNLPGSMTSEVSVIDAILRSTACPIYWPSNNGYVDGWIVANNPCLAAVASALDPRQENRSLDDLRVISFGVGRPASAVTGGNLAWGGQQWSSAPRDKSTLVGGPLMDMIFTNQSMVPAMLTEQMLGSDRFLRVNVDLPAPVQMDDLQQISPLIDLVDAVDIEPYLTWIDTNWM